MKSTMRLGFVSNLKFQISNQRKLTSGHDSLCCHLQGKSSIHIRELVTIRAERGGQLDPQSLVVQSVGVLIGSPLFIAVSYLDTFGGVFAMTHVTIVNHQLDSAADCSSTKLDVVAFAAWPIVFGLNMIVPLCFGWNLTTNHGRIGICIASVTLLAAGWLMCAFQPSIARKLILGSTVIAFSQMYPILQIIAGFVALGVAGGVGLVEDGEFMEQVSSELGGFVVTLLVGCILLIGATTIGLCLGLVMPHSWFQPAAETGLQNKG